MGLRIIVRMLKRTRDMRLLDTFLAEPFSENVGHGLGRECDGEREIDVVPRHGCDILRAGKRVTLFVGDS
jgi:hypothetical protein